MEKKLAVLNIVGLTQSLIGKETPHLKAFFEKNWKAYLQEQFPAVTCTSQACMLTGVSPKHHGIVGNGWYFKELAEVGFWKQNNALIESPKIWEMLKAVDPNFTCAQLFWWYNMYAKVDYSITPRPHYPADGRKVFDIYTTPTSLRDEITNQCGNFPFFNFWGPKAGIESSEWIARSAKYIFKEHQPNLNLVYLPHLDYSLQKFGPEHPNVKIELQKIDQIVGNLIDYYTKNKVGVMIVSEYGITPVTEVIYPNRILRKYNLLKVQKSLSWELLDCGASEAFAVSDHQISHIYVKDQNRIPEIVEIFKQEKGHQQILVGDEIRKEGLDHTRSGEIILMARPNTWYSYYYWLDDQFAPDFARCVDIHRKPGYDPCELFLDSNLSFPKLKIMKNLMKKWVGMRYYMDVIPLDSSLVKGSHGTPVVDRREGPLVIYNGKSIEKKLASMPISDIYHLILKYFTGN